MHYYLSAGNQVLEERVGTSTNASQQYVWGLRYIDDLLLRDRDTNTDGTLDQRLYAIQDANWNLVAIADSAGSVVERYTYTAYGQAEFRNADFSKTDSGLGDVSNYGWTRLSAGMDLDLTTGLYYVRARWYNPALGVFDTRDPIAADPNLYRYCHNNPVIYVDPTGLWTSDTHRQLMKESFLAAFPDYAETIGDACAAYILDILTQSNLGQDNGSMPWSSANQPGQQNYRHYCRDQNQSPAQADTAYTQYLNTESNNFNTALAGGSS